MKFSIIAALALIAFIPSGHCDSAKELRKKSQHALNELLESNSAAKAINDKALAVLVFPEVYKAGFVFGGQRGDGVLFENGEATSYFNTTAASYGFQAGIQKFSYALFFMDQESLDYLNKSEGFELGGAPSLVIADKGFSASMSTTTMQKGICAFFFSQSGLMAGIGIQGTKITKYTPSR